MKKLYLFCFFSFFLFFFTSCSSIPCKNDKKKVLVSIPSYIYFVQKIAGDLVEVSSIVPEGANPHLFEPRPSQVSDAYAAHLWLRTGEAFEEKIARVLTHHKTPITIENLTEGFLQSSQTSCCHHDHSDHHCEEQDLHLWMSIKIAKQQAERIKKALVLLMPQQESVLHSNHQTLDKELDELFSYIQSRLKPYEGQSIIVSHPAFGYFCQDFGLTQLSIEIEGKDPLPKEITSLLEKASRHGVKAILAQVQHNNNGAVAISKHLNLPYSSIDPYSRHYDQMLLQLTQAIVASHE